MSGKNEKDRLLAIWVLTKLGWSFRRIARLNLPRSHHTITHCYELACGMMEAGELPILAKGERTLKIMNCGSSKDIEYLQGKIHQGPCGGGKRVRPHIYDDEWKEDGEQP